MKSLLILLIFCIACGCIGRRNSRVVVGRGIGPRETKVEAAMVEEPQVDRLPTPALPFETVVIYPFEMHRAGLVGTVVARISIDESGKVSSVTITRSTLKEFNSSVIRGVSAMRFFPAIIDSKPVPCFADYEFKFHFGDE